MTQTVPRQIKTKIAIKVLMTSSAVVFQICFLFRVNGKSPNIFMKVKNGCEQVKTFSAAMMLLSLKLTLTSKFNKFLLFINELVDWMCDSINYVLRLGVSN